jgi:8-oxo-dGTP diphosphatase
MTTEYVCGFLFAHERAFVALIEKQRPDWQKGKFNGVGGKIESGEAAQHAMWREFLEETGADVAPSRWTKFATLQHLSRDGVVHFFKADADPSRPAEIYSRTDERVLWCPAHYLAGLPVMDNLRWLIPMAASQDGVVAEIVDRSEARG